MSAYLDPPLVPKQGNTLKALGIARISTEHQDKRSLDDQKALLRDYVSRCFPGPVEWTFIASRGSGEHLDRKELIEAEEKIESRTLDLVVAEDLARICRRKRAYDFCELCEDYDTRLIAVNDRVDTAQDQWKDSAFIATWHHERSNRDTSDRIRRTLRNRFTQGEVFQCPVYGYIKLPGAKNEGDVSKDPAAAPVFDEWFRRLEDGATFAEVADRLNTLGVPTGPYCRTKKWTGSMVGRITRNSILKGVRFRNEMMSRRVNKTGRRKCVKAPPEELLVRHCPHLQFIEPQRYDRVLRLVNARNAKYRRKGVNGIDQRKNIPKKQTAWPGQHLCCGICGRIYHWVGANGRRQMMCSGAVNYKCWNSVMLNGETALRKLIEAILTEVRSLPDFDNTFTQRLRHEVAEATAKEQDRRQEILRRREDIARKIANVTEDVANLGGSRALRDKLQLLEAEEQALDHELADLDQAPAVTVQLPSAEEIRRRANDLLQSLACRDPETQRILRRLIPDLRVYPYRLCDGGAVELRARFTLHLAALTQCASSASGPEGVLRRELTVDLYDPPQRVVHRERVLALRASGLTERQVGREVGITQPAVQRAIQLDQAMKRLGASDPYLILTELPAGPGKLRRHLHPRYRFEPLMGAE